MNRAQLVRLYESGVSLRKLSEQAGIPRSSLSRIMKEEGVDVKRSRQKFSIEDIQKLAIEHGGRCLESRFLGINTLHRFACDKCGYSWKSAPNALVHRGVFCKPCGSKRAGEKRRLSMKAISKSVSRLGGRVLSAAPEKVGKRYKVLVECGACQHQWKIGTSKIGKTWCPACARERTVAASQYDLSFFKDLALRKGGTCLSKRYEGIEQKLIFKCSEGHKFDKRALLLTKANPLSNSWCPLCARFVNLAENLTRTVLECSLKTEFLSGYHFDWLRNSRGRRMQLDGFSEKLGMAFEYHGQQHYSQVSKFGNKDVEKRRADDRLRRSLCRKNGVTLIEVPFFPTRCETLTDHIGHVIQSSKKSGITVPVPDEKRVAKILEKVTSKPMQRLQKLAASKGGRCLSKHYLGMGKKYKWQCRNGHSWQAAASSVNMGTWCGVCHREKRNSKN